MGRLTTRLWRALCCTLLLVLPSVSAWANGKAFEIAPSPAWVLPLAPELDAAPPAADLAGGVHHLLSEHQLRVEGASRGSWRRMVAKALSEKGVESIANIEIRFDPAFQKLTIHQIVVRRGGEVINKLKASAVKVLQRETELEALIFDGSKTAHVFLDDVRVGDVVDYAYTLQGHNPVFAGKQFGRFDLQWSVPVQRVHARLLWPLARGLHLKRLNGATEPTLTQTATHQDYRWDLRELPARQVERDAPAWYDPYPAVHWGEFKDWRAVADWALPLYRLPAQPSAGLRAVAERIAAAHTEPGARLLAAVRHVQAEVRYLGVEIGANSHAPSAPDVVLRRRFGDCKDKTLLTVALLRALGIEAQPALVNTNARRGIQDWLPTPAAFNHVLVRALIDGKPIWLDPTRSPQGGGLQQWVQSDFGAALVIDAHARELVGMAAPAQRMNQREIDVFIDSSAGVGKPVTMTVNTLARGAAAESLRSALASQSHESLQKQYVNYYAQHFSGVAMAQTMRVQDDRALNELRLTEHYLINGFWQRNPVRQRMQADVAAPEVSALLRLPNAQVRQAPLALNHPVELRHVTRVKLPGPWDIKPATARFEHAAFELERSEGFSDGSLTLSDHFRSRTEHLQAADVESYATQLDKARAGLAYQLFVTDGAAAGSDTPHWLLAVLGTLALLLGLWSARRLWLWDPAPAQPAADPWSPLQGLGGWLVLLGLGLLVSLFKQGQTLWQSLPAFSASSWQRLADAGGAEHHPLWGWALGFGLVSNIVLPLLTVLTLVLFFSKRASLPRVYTGLALFSLAVTLVDALFMQAIDSANTRMGARDWGRVLGQCIATAIWIGYLRRSRRVRATFVQRRGAAKAPAPAEPAVA
jgi:transglutaminase-like putative cysteine protease